MAGEECETLDNCQVEWDKRRGVLYVHNKDTGASVVRISGLPVARSSATLKEPGNLIDVRADERASSVLLDADL